MAIDSLDIAYIAIGAKQALEESEATHAAAPFEGELAYVQTCIDQAELLDRAWQGCSDVFPGVWCYEVAEPFGLAFGRHLLAGGAVEAAESILQPILISAVDAAPL